MTDMKMDRKRICRIVAWGGLWLLLAATAAATAVGDPPAGDTDALLPDVFVPYSPDGTDYVLLVEKATQTLFVYAYEDRPREVARFSCSTGKASGRKEVSGDAKTPEGVYFFVEVHEKNRLSPIYGIRAFPMDYPNLMDRIAGRTGSAIWLHGTNKPLKDRDSNGCVTMENDDLDRVTRYITLNRTPIVVVERIEMAPPEANRARGGAALALVADWIRALADGTYHDYVGFYHPDFVPDIAWWSDWKSIRNEGPAPFAVEPRRSMVFRHDDMLVVLFDLELALADGRTRVGAKKLFLRDDGDRLRIVGESFQEVPETDADHPVLLAAGRLRTIPEPAAVAAGPAGEADPGTVASELSDEEIEALVDGWLTAWSAMDIDDYGNYYSRDFRARGMNREDWLRYKDQLNRSYEFIRVTGRNIRAKPEGGGRARVSFVQRYESDRYRGVGLKNLILKREGGEWKIYRETWQKM
jgi:hypothetical protein